MNTFADFITEKNISTEHANRIAAAFENAETIEQIVLAGISNASFIAEIMAQDFETGCWLATINQFLCGKLMDKAAGL